MLLAAVSVVFFFRLRASEYVSPDHSGVDDGKGLRGADARFRRSGGPTPAFAEADEVAVLMRGSKTDQPNGGEHRNHHRVADEDFARRSVSRQGVAGRCRHTPAWRMAPERFCGVSDLERLVLFEDGTLLTREDAQTLVASAAVAEGLGPNTIGSHSLRIAGASALCWAKYKDSALVQMWGRWKSDAFQAYLRDAREAARGVASDNWERADSHVQVCQSSYGVNIAWAMCESRIASLPCGHYLHS